MIGDSGEYSPGFKAEVALAALRADRSYSELAAGYGVPAGEIARWVAILERGAESLFRAPASGLDAGAADADTLYREIGRLMMERDELARRCGASTNDDEDDDRDRPDVLIPQD